MELPVITSDGHGGTLEIRVVQSTIRGAEIVDTTSEIGRLATLETPVLAALSAVVGQDIDSASTDFLAALRDARDAYDGNPSAVPAIFGHRNRSLPPPGDTHLEPDSVNALDGGIPFSLKYAVKLVNELREKLIGHFENSIKYAEPTGTAPPPQFDKFWHFTAEIPTQSGLPIYVVGPPQTGRPGVDSTCTPIMGPAKDLPSAAVLLCELRVRGYSRHIHLSHVNGTHPWLTETKRSAPHIRIGEPPEDQLLVPVSLVDEIIVEYLDSIIRMDPNFSPPPAEGSGIANMSHKYGFKVKGT
jgi:hypothetical protein